jgi:hypothetical protein
MSNAGLGTERSHADVRVEAQPTEISLGRRAAAFLDSQKDRITSIQSLVTILALFVGGFWTYRIFIEQRQDHPRLKVEHRIQYWKISSEQVLLSVDEVLTNTGSVKVDLPGGIIRVIQVMPLPPSVAAELSIAQQTPTHSRAEASIYDPTKWYVLVDSHRTWKSGSVVIEPGESDTVPNEFIIPAAVRVVAVYSFVNNPENARLGWNGLTYYDLEKPVAVSEPRPADRQ